MKERIWNVDSLKEYLDKRIDDLDVANDRAVQDAKTAADKAIEVNAKIIEKRLDSMNEFREQLRDQAGTFITRSEYEIANKSLSDKIDGLSTTAAILVTRASQGSVNFSYIYSTIILVITVVMHFWPQ